MFNLFYFFMTFFSVKHKCPGDNCSSIVLLYDIENKAYRCGMCGRTFSETFLTSYLTENGYRFSRIFDKIFEENPELKRDYETMKSAFLDFLKRWELRQPNRKQQSSLKHVTEYYLNKKK